MLISKSIVRFCSGVFALLVLSSVCAVSFAQTEYENPIPLEMAPFAGDFLLPNGDRFIVSEHESSLTIAGQGEKAVGILLYGDTFQNGWLWVFQQFNKRAHKSMSNLITEGMPAFRADLDPVLSVEGSNEIAEVWMTYVEMVGKPRSATVLGSVPDSEGVSVYVSIEFQKTNLTWKISYSLNRMIESFVPVKETHPVKVELVPVSHSKFVGTAVDNRSDITVEYEYKSDGSPGNLKFVGEDHSVVAERVMPHSEEELQRYVGIYTFTDGSLLRIDRDQKQLRATGVGQEAFARLYLGRNLDAATAARMKYLSNRVKDLMDPLLRGEPQEFKRSVNSIGRGHGSGPILQDWQDCIDLHGAPRSLHILGAIPTLNDPICYFAVTFSRMPVVYQLTLTPDLTVGCMEPVDSLAEFSVVLSPLGDGVFAGCAVDKKSPLRLNFVADQQGQMTLERSELGLSIAVGVDFQDQ
ncbi:MAG: hypothetical protein P8J86_00110 [Phycisphaerales bacterium]|nr:hypothetical protein [Phycisphaerales bacterium]